MHEVTVTYAEAVKRQEQQYRQDIATGRFRPAVEPWTSLNVTLLIIAIYTAPARSRRNDRWFFIAIVAASVWSLLRYRSPGIIGSIVVGLNACMVTIFAINFLLIRDPRRVKRAYRMIDHPQSENGELDTTSKVDTQRWQTIPEDRKLRIWWTLDLITCMRALKWSWNPQGVSSDLISKPSPILSSFYKRHLVRFVCGYMCLDILKCIMIADPHFYGLVNCTAPPALRDLPRLLVRAYRMLLAAAGVASAVQCYGSAWALFQVGVLGPQFLGINGEPRMYPPLFGSPSAIFKHGLKGFWSHTWHQVFRAHFTSIAEAVAGSHSEEDCAGRCNELRAATRLFTVFFISGILHACGSYTLLGPSYPAGSFFAFAVQPVGILLQAGASNVIRQSVPQLADHAVLRGVANVAISVIWLMITCIPLANDFSVGGMWMLEPVPISFTRGLGMSSHDSRWFPWVGSP